MGAIGFVKLHKHRGIWALLLRFLGEIESFTPFRRGTSVGRLRNLRRQFSFKDGYCETTVFTVVCSGEAEASLAFLGNQTNHGLIHLTLTLVQAQIKGLKIDKTHAVFGSVQAQ